MIATYPNIHGSGELHYNILKIICGDTSGKSMIDLCCGEAITTRRLGFNDRVYCDVVRRDLQEENDHFMEVDILKFTPARTYDVSICLDGIEHFAVLNAFDVLELMNHASKKQILFTPLGPYVTQPLSIGPDTHKSAWYPEELPEYACIVFPHYHPTLGIGAFYFFKCDNLQDEFDRVKIFISSLLNTPS